MDLSCIIQSGDLELYVMGLLPADESRKVEELALLFPEIRAELDAIAATLENAAMQSAVTPPAQLKEKIIASLPDKNDSKKARVIPMKPVERSGTSSNRWAIAASWILVVMLGGLGAYLYNNNNKLSTDIAGLKKNDSTKTEQVNTLTARVTSYEKITKMKADTAVMTVHLGTAQPGVQQYAEVLWNKVTKEVYIDPTALPKAPTGKQYQLWFIVNGTPVDAGMIDPSDSSILQKMKTSPDALQVFAITLEKKGGHPTPQGPIIVAGKTGG